MDPGFPTRQAVSPLPATHIHLQPPSFAPSPHARYREAEALGGFAGGYPGPPSRSPTVHHGFRSPSEYVHSPQQQQQQPLQRRQPPYQRQADGISRPSSTETVSRAAPTPPDHFSGVLRPGSHEVEKASLANDAPVTNAEAPRGGRLPAKIVENPPDLDVWRQRLFDLESAVIMSTEEYETYFPWVDNVYSHRSTQPYKRKTFVTHYYDCRMKGRPSGTPKPSADPNRKKRKRAARPLDLCGVKIKITEYQAGSASELLALAQSGDGSLGLDGDALEAATARIGDKPFWVMQRINGSNAATNGGAVATAAADSLTTVHMHDLRKSDEIKLSTAHRWLVERDKEQKRNQKSSPWKPTGPAAVTAKLHSKEEEEFKFYSACFCPFSQRVWIALEAKGLKYQYCETYPLRKPKPQVLLEANPRGLVPAIRQGRWACSESYVILEYLEDLDNGTPLYPTEPRLKANYRLWIDLINTQIVPAFYSILAATDEEARVRGFERLHRHISALVSQGAVGPGPFFFADQICLVDVHIAPFALRMSRLQPFKDWPPSVPRLPARWQQWLEALEQNVHVRNTTSGNKMYADSMEDLLKGFQGMYSD